MWPFRMVATGELLDSTRVHFFSYMHLNISSHLDFPQKTPAAHMNVIIFY